MSDKVQLIISYQMTSRAILETKRCERLVKAFVEAIEEVAGE
jgi:hypothetical protein